MSTLSWQVQIVSNLCIQYGRNDGIRTHDLLVPNQAHYQAVLRPEIYSIIIGLTKIEKINLICFR